MLILAGTSDPEEEMKLIYEGLLNDDIEEEGPDEGKHIFI